MATDGPERKASLFRQEAIDHQSRHVLLGDIALAQPVSLSVLMWFVLGIGVAIAAFLTFGSYTRKAAVSGYLVPDKGLLRIAAPDQAIVIRRFFEDGQAVDKDAVLYELSLDRINSARIGTAAEIARQVKGKIESLRDELAKHDQSNREQMVALRKREQRLVEELQQARQEARLSQQRAALSAATVTRFQQLYRAKYVPELQLREKQQLLIEHQMEHRALERTASTTQRQLEDVQAEVTDAPAKAASREGVMRRELATFEQELAQNEARSRILITAPVEGIATAGLVGAGSSVSAGAALANIVPLGSLLQVELFASSKSIGFVHEGVQVRLRYQAFPHQKFGHQAGRVVTVSPTPIALADLPADRTSAGEPLYRIVVAIDAQAVDSQGKRWPLSPGMRVEADLLLERRRLFEWLIEPLQALQS
jgi:membrane fusion protein